TSRRPPPSSWVATPSPGSRRTGCRLPRAISRAMCTGSPGGRSARRIQAGFPMISEQSPRKLDQHGTMSADGPRVLVVDDEPNITELVSMALRYEVFNVKTAATGRGAITAVTQFSPALVILDVMLPDIDGIEVLRRLNSA